MPLKQAIAKKIRGSFVLVGIFSSHNLSEIKGKVNKKNFLAIINFFCYIYCEKIHKFKNGGKYRKGGS